MRTSTRYLFVFSLVLFVVGGIIGCSDPSDKEIKAAISTCLNNKYDVKDSLIKLPPGARLMAFNQPSRQVTISEIKILKKAEKYKPILERGTEVTPVRVYIKGTTRKRYGMPSNPKSIISFAQKIEEDNLSFEGEMDFYIRYTPQHETNSGLDSVPAKLEAVAKAF